MDQEFVTHEQLGSALQNHGEYCPVAREMDQQRGNIGKLFDKTNETSAALAEFRGETRATLKNQSGQLDRIETKLGGGKSNGGSNSATWTRWAIGIVAMLILTVVAYAVGTK